MFHFPRYENLFRFDNIQAVRIQSLLNPFRKCHKQTNPPFSLIEYLQSSLGFSPERSRTLSQQLKGRNPKKPNSVLTFLKSHGFSEANIKSIINRAPSLLSYVSPESSLTPKLQFFKEKGISESVLMDLVVANPHLFTHSVEGHIKPVFDLLRSILGTDEFAVELLIRSRLIFNLERLSTNLTILRNCGVPDHHLSNKFMNQPRALEAKPDRFNDVIEMV